MFPTSILAACSYYGTAFSIVWHALIIEALNRLRYSVWKHVEFIAHFWVRGDIVQSKLQHGKRSKGSLLGHLLNDFRNSGCRM